MFSVLVIRLRSLRLLRVSGIVMRLRMCLLLITCLKASHSFRNRLLVICKNAYLFATMIMTSVSSPFSCFSGIVRLNFFFQAEDGIRAVAVTGVQTCALPIWPALYAGSAMSRSPTVIATWPFGLPACQVAWKILQPGGGGLDALDAVEAGVTH